MLYVYNKCDRLSIDISGIQSRPDTVFISAKTGEGIESLVCALEDAATQNSGICDFFFPMNEAKQLDRLYKNAVVSDVQYVENGICVRAIVDAQTKGALSRFIVNKEEE